MGIYSTVCLHAAKRVSVKWLAYLILVLNIHLKTDNLIAV